MKRRRRRGSSEINLTPLLDILFSILFIVMMTNVQNEADIKDEYQQNVGKMEQEITDLKEQVTISQNQMSSYDKYNTEAVIITICNVVDEGEHHLIVKKGLNEDTMDNILLGTDRIENTKARIEWMITMLVEGIDNQPVYIVFYCDKENIYTTEYRAIVDTFNVLQETHKEVFFKVMEEKK